MHIHGFSSASIGFDKLKVRLDRFISNIACVLPFASLAAAGAVIARRS
jgi:hypothetical protein